MKKLLLSVVMTAMCATPLWAQEFESGGIYYEVTDATKKTVKVTNGTNAYTGSVAIPGIVTYDEVNYSVTEIGSYAFDNCEGLTAVTIPNSVTLIGRSAFKQCLGLTEVTIPNSVTKIEADAFYVCRGLTRVSIGSGVTEIGRTAFSSCWSLEEIVCYATTPPAIESSTFTEVDKTKPLYVLASSIEKYKAADNWKEFTNVQAATLAVGAKIEVDSIHYEVTSSADKTVAVTYQGSNPDDVEEYTGEVTIPESVTYEEKEYKVTAIGTSAFRRCKSLTAVTIPASVTKIETFAFAFCDKLENVMINGEVASMGNGAFSGCSSLKEFVCLSTTPPAISSATFMGVDDATPIYVPKGSVEAYKTDEKWKEFTNIQAYEKIVKIEVDGIYYEVTSSADKTVAVTYKGNSYSEYNEYIGDVVIAESVTYEEVEYSVTAIGPSAFRDCDSLKSVVVPASVTAIEFAAFQKCTGLEKVMINGEVASMSNAAFGNCESLKEFVCLSITPPAINSATFMNVDKATPIYVPERSVEAYKAADQWSKFTNIQAYVKIVLADSIALDKDSVEMLVGDSLTLVATVLPDSVTNSKVEWSSNNEAVATVDSLGNVVAVAEGVAIITVATTDSTNLSAQCVVEVKQPTDIVATSIALDKDSAVMLVGSSLTLVATILPEDATSQEVVWSSNNEAVATVDSLGNVVAVAEGVAIITATTTDGTNLTAQCVVEVKQPSGIVATSIALDKDSAAMIVGDSLTLVATVLPDSVTNSKVEWSSNNEAVATVDSLGNVVAVAEGVAIITATTTDGTNLTAQCVVEVKQPSGIVSTDADGVAIVTESGAIVVKNAPMGSVVNIYTITGTVAATTQVTAPVTRIAVDTRGIYIVQVGNTAKKVVM